jgi:hypothetical protein
MLGRTIENLFLPAHARQARQSEAVFSNPCSKKSNYLYQSFPWLSWKVRSDRYTGLCDLRIIELRHRFKSWDGNTFAYLAWLALIALECCQIN